MRLVPFRGLGDMQPLRPLLFMCCRAVPSKPGAHAQKGRCFSCTLFVAHWTLSITTGQGSCSREGGSRQGSVRGSQRSQQPARQRWRHAWLHRQGTAAGKWCPCNLYYTGSGCPCCGPTATGEPRVQHRRCRQTALASPCAVYCRRVSADLDHGVLQSILLLVHL